MRLYYHQTDGGAEYLCSSNVPGTDEGSLQSKFVIRLDGDITKDAELFVKNTESKTKNDDKFLTDCRMMADYLLESEEDHWEENDKPSGHIYTYAKRADKHLRKIGIN